MATAQPPLILGATLEARTSLPGTIFLGDMELPAMLRLANSVYFVAVSRDRLRFHVTLLHKWEEIADPSTWRAWIEDDQGRRSAPEGVDRRGLRPVTTMVEPSRSSSASTLQTLSAVTVYRGDGDYVFYRRDLLRKNLRWLMLVMVRPGYEYRYVWSFAEPDGVDRLATTRAAGSRADHLQRKSIVANRLSN